jgi:serine protease Do
VTSAHVVTGIGVTVVTSDGRVLAGDIIRRDAGRDLAVVHAPGAGVPPAGIGDPYSLRPGALVFAVGHPFGVKDAISLGVFQATSPLPRGYLSNGKGSLAWVQADLRLAPGNSGGPLADVHGNVIGVAAMIVSGLALGVPAPDVQRLLLGLA